MSADHAWLSLAAAAGIWFISLSGALLGVIPRAWAQRLLPPLMSLSAGLLVGDSFLHLLPDALHRGLAPAPAGLMAIGGYVAFWLIERALVRGPPAGAQGIEQFARMEILGDSLHNLVDGLMLGASFVVGLPLGVLATLAIAAHEIPREIGNVGVLVAGGYSLRRAILINFACGTGVVVGAAIAVAIGHFGLRWLGDMLAAAAGGMLYVASADFLPALRPYCSPRQVLAQAAGLVIGVGIMWALLACES